MGNAIGRLIWGSGRSAAREDERDRDSRRQVHPCDELMFKFVECTRWNENNASACDEVRRMLSECEKKYGAVK